MANYCGECAHLDWNNKSNYAHTYYCKEMGKYKELTERCCSYFIFDPEKVQSKGTYQQSGCYITTIVCQILGYDDNCELLTTLRNFRENYLKIHLEYLYLLVEYDYIGPIISNLLQKDEERYTLSLNLTSQYLIPCVNHIKNKNYEDAIDIYQRMVMYLKERYNIPEKELDSIQLSDFTNLGKGRTKKVNK